jgi:hypothetical protein
LFALTQATAWLASCSTRADRGKEVSIATPSQGGLAADVGNGADSEKKMSVRTRMCMARTPGLQVRDEQQAVTRIAFAGDHHTRTCGTLHPVRRPVRQTAPARMASARSGESAWWLQKGVGDGLDGFGGSCGAKSASLERVTQAIVRARLHSGCAAVGIKA